MNRTTFFRNFFIVLMIIGYSSGGFSIGEELLIKSVEVYPKTINPERDTALINISLNKTSDIDVKIINNQNKIIKTYNTVSGSTFIKTWDGRDAGGKFVDDGLYSITMDAKNGSSQETKTSKVYLWRKKSPAIQKIYVYPVRLSPNNDGFSDFATIGLTVSENSFVTIQLKKNGRVVHKILDQKYRMGGSPQNEIWSGRDINNKKIPPGSYEMEAIVKNIYGWDTARRPITILNSKAPVVSDKKIIVGKLKKMLVAKQISRRQLNVYLDTVKKTVDCIYDYKDDENPKYGELATVFHDVSQQIRLRGVSASRIYYLMELTLKNNVNYLKEHQIPRQHLNMVKYNGFVYLYFKNNGIQLQPFLSLQEICKSEGSFLRNFSKILPAFENRNHNGIDFMTIDYPFRYYDDATFWPSSLAQGQALKAFALAYKLTGKQVHLSRANKVLNSFLVLHQHGGILDKDSNGNKWFLEYGFTDKWRVLNGSILSLQQLNSYIISTSDINAGPIFEQGFAGVCRRIAQYDYALGMGDQLTWSKYSLINYPANEKYHDLNLALIKWMVKKSNNDDKKLLQYYVSSWQKGLDWFYDTKDQEFYCKATKSGYSSFVDINFTTGYINTRVKSN